MGARQKLNALHINGGIIMAAIAGLATGSCWISMAVLIATLGASFYTGDIRPSPRRRSQ